MTEAIIPHYRKTARRCPLKHALPLRACKICGVSYSPQREWQKFCSAKCRENHHQTYWGHARKRVDETEQQFKNRINRYRRKTMIRYAKKHSLLGLCRACTDPVIPGTKCWCEKHWFIQAAHRNGIREKGDWVRIKELLEKQNYECPYTGRKLVVGINASIDHKNPGSRFPDQREKIINIEWVDLDVNKAKRDLTKKEFLELCHIVSSRNQQPPETAP